MDPPPLPGARITVVAGDGADEVVVARLHGLRPDLDLLDRMARLQLAAARLGIAVRFSEPCPTLRQVLELTGLDERLLDESRPESGGAGSVEVVGQVELGEVGGVEEVGPGGDAAVGDLEHVEGPGAEAAGGIGLVARGGEAPVGRRGEEHA